MFDGVYQIIVNLASEAWVFVAGLIIIVALLGGLYYVLQGTAGTAFGASNATKMAIVGALGLILLVLLAFLIIPQMSTILYQHRPTPPFQ
ncbi:hypothetical protein [Anaerolinea sp.]|uniref:hypothetical protein n=1 Tax=Anaerolinea sp. TaxID=1872519 RepID=UPI002ACEEB70|nr:hypothetical protein [Anaerolinea sp.]